MTIDKDPPRLSDSASPDDALLRTALREARSDVSPDDALARILARFPPDPGPGGGDASPGEPLAKGAVGKGAVPAGSLAAAPAPLLGSVILGALAGAFVSLGLWITDADTTSPRPGPPTSLVAPSSSALSGPDSPVAQAPSDSASPRGSRPAAPDPSTAKSAALPAAAPEADPSAPGSAAPADTAGSAANAPGSSAPVEAVETEGALLARAQSLVGANPAGALALTEEHRARFPRGALGQEREVLAITALVGMGRAAEARARAEGFLSANPSSAHRRRLSRIVPGLPAE